MIICFSLDDDNLYRSLARSRLAEKNAAAVGGSSLSNLPSCSSRTDTSDFPSLLGESLIDPPQSIQKYPKRYQSPNRCGSPSLETPEHLIFAKKGKTSTHYITNP